MAFALSSHQLYNNSQPQAMPSIGNWKEMANTNCWAGHGADDLEIPAMSAAGRSMTLEACQAACLGMGDNSACDSITVFYPTRDKLQMDCYRRKNTNPSQCDKNGKGSSKGFTTFMRPTPQPTPPTPFAPTPATPTKPPLPEVQGRHQLPEKPMPRGQ